MAPQTPVKLIVTLDSKKAAGGSRNDGPTRTMKLDSHKEVADMVKILLLDDSSLIHRVVNLTLEKTKEFKVTIGKTPPEAQTHLDHAPFDLVIAYIRFDKTQGIEFIKQLNMKVRQLLVLVDSTEDAQLLAEHGVCQTLRKPFNHNQLLQAVGSLLGHQPTPPQDTPTTEMSPPPPMMPPPPPPPRPMARSRVETSNELPIDKEENSQIRHFDVEEISMTFAPPASAMPFANTRSAKSQSPGETSERKREIPEVTMDLDSLTDSFRSTIPDLPAPFDSSPDEEPGQSSFGHEDTVSRRPKFQLHESDEPEESKEFEEPESETKPTRQFSEDSGVSIQFADIENSTPEFEVEDVVTHRRNKKNRHPSAEYREAETPIESQPQVDEAMVEEVLFRVIERTVPAKIEARLDSVWPEIVEAFVKKNASDISSEAILRIKNEIADDVAQAAVERVLVAAQEQAVQAFRDWGRNHLANLAKEELRKQIQELLEGE